jgi:hypothetical protein
VPPLSTILEIEGVVTVDQAGPTTPTGVGTGAVLLVGEFEDGLFATDNKGILEVFGEQDYLTKYGGFGFTYDGVPSSNPCARQHDGELWNGNGFLKSFGLKCSRLFIGRVDTSVGQVSFQPLAVITGTKNVPVALPVGGQITATTDVGGPASSTALAATSAVITGVAGTYPTLFAGGETIEIETNQGTKQVVFSVTDQALADVVTRINTAVGFTIASISGGQLRLTNTTMLGTASFVRVADVTTGVLAILGMTASTVNGTGTVANIDAVTMAEVAAIINGTAGLTAIEVTATVTSDGYLRIQCGTPGTGTLNLTSTPMALALGLTVGSTISADEHAGGTIPAGSRVRTAGGLEWVTMQTLDVDAEATGPFNVKVRPALDDGTAVGTAINTVTVLVDQPLWAALSVNNPVALSVALTEPQIDVAYNDVLLESLDTTLPCKDANYLLSARRTDTLVIYCTQNTKDADAAGLFGRKFPTGPRLGTSPDAAITAVASGRYDRKFFTAFGLKVNIPQIAARGAAGGLGFTEDGVITVRPDGPLTTLCAMLAPEEDPGQQTNMIDQFFEVDTFGFAANIDVYKAFKRNGIVAPRVDSQFGTFFQSSVTTDLDPARVEIFRRKMADFIIDSIPSFAMKYCKKLSKQVNRDALRTEWEAFLASLQAAEQPSLSRIVGYTVDDSVNAGNTLTNLGLGLFFVKSRVRLYNSLKDLIFVTEIGPNVVISTEER